MVIGGDFEATYLKALCGDLEGEFSLEIIALALF